MKQAVLFRVRTVLLFLFGPMFPLATNLNHVRLPCYIN